jgi:hypothetical protein
MNLKQLGYAVGALVVLLLIYFAIAPGREQQKSVDADLLAVDSAEVMAINIVKGLDSFAFKMTEGQWQLNDYPVDQNKFDQLHKDLTNLEVDRFVTKNATKFGQYEVDSTATLVTITGKEEETLASYYLGKTNFSSGENFIRKAGGNKVYAVSGNLSQYKNLKVDNYWNKTMVNFTPNDVVAIELAGTYNYSIEQMNMGWVYSDSLIDMQKAEQLVKSLVQQNATAFADKAVPAESELLQWIKITPREGSPVEVKYYANADKSTTHYVQVTGNDKVFEFPSSRMKGFDKTLADLK